MVNGKQNQQQKQAQMRKAAAQRANARRNLQNQGQSTAIIRRRPKVPKGLDPKHHFNAFGHTAPQALSFSIGPATHLTGYRSVLFGSYATNPSMFIFQPGGGVDQLTRYTTTDGGVTWAAGSSYNIDSTGIALGGASATVPDQVMCSRGSLRYRNVSRAADAGGVVKVLRLSSGMFNDSTAWANLYRLVQSHPRTHGYSGSALTAAHQWDCIPVSQAEYTSFRDPTTGPGATGVPPLTSIVIVMEAFSTVQDIEITFAANYYARYRVAGPLASMSRPPPTCSVTQTNLARDAAEAIGSAGRKVGNAILDGVTDMTTGYIGNLFRQQVSTGMVGRTSAITGIEELAPLALAL